MLGPACPSAHPPTLGYCSLPPALSPFAHALAQPMVVGFAFATARAFSSLFFPSPLPSVRLFTVAMSDFAGNGKADARQTPEVLCLPRDADDREAMRGIITSVT